ncbi:MAG: epoxyqueuosine reductase QueH [Pseudomonadota bacterium]|nr:epoxyqueuosine reductase QueH [Pseudomonadota bacterium]
MKKYLYIVRHGETIYNAKGICQGQMLNAGLNETGKRQAKAAAGELENCAAGAVYTSPMKRARETARIIGQHLHLKPKVHAGLTEGNFGIAEGMSMEMVRRWPEYPDWINPAAEYMDAHYEGGESKSRIRSRVMQALEDICREEKAETIIIVTHSAVARLLNWEAGNRESRLLPNGSVCKLVYEDGHLSFPQDNLLLLSCCAPCSCAVIKKLSEGGTKFSVVFYNPNIRPKSEYEKRCAENKRVCEIYGVPFIELEYDNERWCRLTKGLENEPERGRRCSVCFEMRLLRVMEYAKAHGFTAVSSVLGVSRYKNLEQVNKAAAKAGQTAGFPYQLVEGRKNGMQELRSRLIEELDLYNQDYCGCKPRQSGK